MIWRFTYANKGDSQPLLTRNYALRMAVDSYRKQVQKICIV